MKRFEPGHYLVNIEIGEGIPLQDRDPGAARRGERQPRGRRKEHQGRAARRGDDVHRSGIVADRRQIGRAHV